MSYVLSFDPLHNDFLTAPKSTWIHRRTRHEVFNLIRIRASFIFRRTCPLNFFKFAGTPALLADILNWTIIMGELKNCGHEKNVIT